MSESRWGKGRNVPFGNTCAVAICISPRNVMYHRFPRQNGTILYKRKIHVVSTISSCLPAYKKTCLGYYLYLIMSKLGPFSIRGSRHAFLWKS